jgi:hypothetical protein
MQQYDAIGGIGSRGHGEKGEKECYSQACSCKSVHPH